MTGTSKEESMDEDEPTRSWEAFLAVASRQRQVKLSALDVFLHQFLTHKMIQSGGSSRFREVDGVSSILTRHFLADVHTICLESDGEDDAKLMSYLVEGRGGRILRVLKTTGVQGITCSLEFANLLLSLMSAFRSYSIDDNKSSEFLDKLSAPVDVDSRTDSDLFPALPLLTAEIKSRKPSVILQRNKTNTFISNSDDDKVMAILDDCERSDQYEAFDGKNVFDLIVFIVERLCLNDVKMASTSTLASTVLTVLADLIRASTVNRLPFREIGFHFSKKFIALAVRDAIALGRSSIGMNVILKSHICANMLGLLKSRLDATSARNLELTSTIRLDCLLEEALNIVLGYIGVLLSCATNVTDGNYIVLTQLFYDFFEYSGPALIARCLTMCIEHWEIVERGEFSGVLGQAIWALGDLGSSLRKIRLHAQHLELGDRNCTRRWKWSCSSALTLTSTRHHDLCLAKSRSFPSTIDPIVLCPVAAICLTLMSNVIQSAMVSEAIAACLLSALNRCGSCCCMDVGVDVCGPVFELLKDSAIESSPLRQLSLRHLESNLLASRDYRVSLDCVSVACHRCKARIESEAELLDAGLRIANNNGESDEFHAWLQGSSCATIFSPYYDLILKADSSLLLILERHLHTIVKGSSDLEKMQLLSSVFLPLLVTLSCEDYMGNACDETTLSLVKLCLDSVVKLISCELNGACSLLRAARKSVANLCPLMIKPQLRESVLGLLRIFMLDEVKSFGGEMKLQDFILQPRDSFLILFQEILLKHTIHYKDLLQAIELSLLSERPSNCPLGRRSILEGNEDNDELIICLTDLWRTICYLLDHSSFYRRHLWSELPAFQNVVSATVSIIARSEFKGSTIAYAAKWDLFGRLLHVAIICAPEEANKWTSNIGPYLEAKLLNEDPVICGIIIRSMVSAFMRVTNLDTTVNSTQVTSNDDQFNDFGIDTQFGTTSIWGYSSDDDGGISTHSSERGYDADAEDEITKRGISSLSISSVGLVRSKAIHNDRSRKSNQQLISCPLIVKFVLKLATIYKDHLIVKKKESDITEDVENLIVLFRSLVSIGSSSIMNADVLQRIGGVDVILNDYVDVLKSDDQYDLKDALLLFFIVCAGRSITPAQLQSYLRLILVCDSRTTGKLIDALYELSETSKLVPAIYLQFTTASVTNYKHQLRDQATADFHSSFEESTKSSLVSSSSSTSLRRKSKKQLDGAETARNFVLEMSAAHRGVALNSSWAKALVAGSFPSPDEASLFALGRGLTVAVWLSLDVWNVTVDDARMSSGFDKIHLISCGIDGLTIEAWFQPETKSFLVKLAQSTSESYNVLDERSLRLHSGASLDEWHLLVISWLTTSVGPKRMALDVQICLMPTSERDDIYNSNPSNLFAFGLTCQWKESFGRIQRWYLLIGHRDRENTRVRRPEEIDERITSWSFGSLAVYRGQFATPDFARTIYDLGPYALQLDIVEIKKSNTDRLDDLRSMRVLSYAAQLPDVFTWYPSPLKSSKIFQTVPDYPPSILGLSKVFDRCVRHIPVMHFGRRALKTVIARSLNVAVFHLGGPRLVLTLFGTIVELYRDDEIVRSKCLALLVSLTRRDLRFGSQHMCMSGWDLVVEALTRCQRRSVTSRTLQLLLSACTSHPVLMEDLIDQKWWVDQSTTATVTDASLFSCLLANWKLWSWQNENIDCLSKLLGVIQALVRVQHPFREQNLKSLKDKGILDAVLNVCRERAFDSDDICEPLSVRSCQSIVEIIRRMVEPYPDSEIVDETMNMLVAIHPSQLVYVCQSFYFIPTEIEELKTPITSISPMPSIALTNNKQEVLNFQTPDSDIDKFGVEWRLDFGASCSSPDFVGSLPECDQELMLASFTPEITLPASHSCGKLTESEEDEDGDNDDDDDDEGVFVDAKEDSDGDGKNEVTFDGKEEFEDSSQSYQSTATMPGRILNSDKRSLDDLVIISKGVLEFIFGPELLEVTVDVIDPEILIVLALHSDEGVRVKVFEALKAYSEFLISERRSNYSSKYFYRMFANQVFHWECSEEIAEACFRVIIDDNFTFDNGVLNAPQNLTACPLMLAILPRTSSNVTLCHNTIITLRQICHKSSIFIKELADYGLVQSLCLTISAITHGQLSPTDIYGESEQNLLIEDINSFLEEFVSHFISIHGEANHQIVTLTLDILSYYELLEQQKCGINVQCVLAFRASRSICLQKLLKVVQTGFDWNYKVNEFQEESRAISIFSNSKQSDQIVKTKLATTSDHRERLAVLLSTSVDFVLFSESVSEKEWPFICHLFRCLMEGCLAILNKRRMSSWSERPKWHYIVYPLHDIFRIQFGRLLVFLLAPTQPFNRRSYAINSVLGVDCEQTDLILYVIKANSQLEVKFRDFLNSFLDEHKWLPIEMTNREACLSLCDILKKHVVNKPIASAQCRESWIESSAQSKRLWRRLRLTAMKRTMQKAKEQAAVIGDAAAVVTTMVSEIHNGQFKRYLEHVKRMFGRRLRLRNSWQDLAEQFTHEKAVWYRPESYPSSWKLDEFEGPQRVRKRLERCQLTVDQRFLLEENREKLAKVNHRQPFAYLFDNDQDHSNDLATIYDQLQNTEKIRCTYPSKIVTPSTETEGELLLGNRCLYFVGEQSTSIMTPRHQPVKLKSHTEVVSHSWHFEDVKEVMKRRFLLQDNAVELFMSNGKTFIISFTSLERRNSLFDQLMASYLPNLASDGDIALAGESRLWRDQLTTNFEYLTHLNKMAGRSFNDLMQYPVFPFVLADYSSSVLDLNDIRSFRNLSKPMAIQDSKREQHYVNQYTFLERELQVSYSSGNSVGSGSGYDQSTNAMPDNYGPYHYGSHYSNSGIVLHFLVRLPHFTSMFLAYQDNNFDLPDRTFHALQTSWRLSSSESTTDVKELIPEFFFLPEFLTNFEGFDFGVRQSGDRVNDVTLPPWCRGDPRLFILIHRQALESAIVTENLHHWIDLVFGYKQTGKAAVEAINVFHPATYYGFDKDQVTDPLRQIAIETMVKSFGQTPMQLFRHAHPMVSLHLSVGSPLVRRNSSKLAVMEEVVGLRWGKYVGSPDESDPRTVWHKRQPFPISSFVPMVTNEVFGLSANTALLVQYCKDSKGASMINTTYLTSAALIYWGHHDGLLWIQLQQDRSPQPFMAIDVSDQVTACGTTPDCLLLFLGKKSGIISIQRVSFNQSKPGVTLVGDSTELYGHAGAVLDLYLCSSYSIAVSSSADAKCIIWDLNRLRYVRSIEDHVGSVRLVMVSETSGDIASVSDVLDVHGERTGSRQSCLMLHTINAKQIGKVVIEAGAVICSVCFSTAPEGISTNIICAGMSDGSIRMWSSWDLLPVRTIRFDKFTRPVTCVAYSLDCQHLYAANSKGFVTIFECSSKSTNSVPKFRTII